MAGATHQIQIRHILVEKKDVAELLIETIGSIPKEIARVQMLMNLAGKYSVCAASKEDGGNLGWLEVGWNKSDPRQPRGGFKSLSNDELNDYILDGKSAEFNAGIEMLNKLTAGTVHLQTRKDANVVFKNATGVI